MDQTPSSSQDQKDTSGSPAGSPNSDIEGIPNPNRIQYSLHRQLQTAEHQAGTRIGTLAAALFPPVPYSDEEDTQQIAIPPNAVEYLVQSATHVIAEIIQCYIDAGSERDVTFEDEALRQGLEHAFNDWTPVTSPPTPASPTSL